jgi:4-amino-4-deoxy-L-arabinose transferase-like glycosyltransferase
MKAVFFHTKAHQIIALVVLFGLALFLITPFGISASRSFQPDPFMGMWILIAAWSLYRWGETPTWKWVILSGFQ